MIRFTACILFVSAATISSLRANDPQGPVELDTGLNLYELPNLSFQTSEPPPIPGDDYAVLSADVTTSSNGTVQDDWLIPYDPSGGLPEVSILNELSEPLTLSNVGFQLSTTEIPLDSLNYGNDTPLPSLDGPLGAGADSPAVELPEPSSFSLVVLAMLAGAFWRVICLRNRRAT
jgi:hypothetical protein